MSDSINDKEILIQEQPKAVPIQGLKTILFQLENCICKIHQKNGGKGTGFFCKILFQNELLPVLITNNSILNENHIKDNEIIDLTMHNNEEKSNKDISIKIDSSRKRYTNPEIDITIIEIKPKIDNINNYLEIDKDKLTEKEFRKKSIYLLHYPNEKYVSYGIINDLKEYKTLIHYCNTEDGSSGSPILSLNSYKVIGIHNRYSKSNKYKLNYGTYIKYAINEINKKYKNEINLKYITKDEKNENIFGEKFVKNNINNIDLIINGEKSKLIKEYKLIKGINDIKMIIRNKITNLEYMFYECHTLKDINELKYLDTKDINNFSYMFSKCLLLSDIKSLHSWNVSNGNNFESMFAGCSSLSDIRSLQHWNVSNGNNFCGMFVKCSSLSDIKSLQNWDVSKGNNFSGMFFECTSLSTVKYLQNWNVSKGDNFSYMFVKCSSLSDIKSLQNWNVSNGNNFSYMFSECSSLSDIKSLQNWNVSNGNNFCGMFNKCPSLSNIKSLQNWNVSNGNNFSYMFSKCSLLSDVKSLQNWNVSKGNNFESMFGGCSSSLDIKSLQNWNIPHKQYNKLK